MYNFKYEEWGPIRTNARLAEEHPDMFRRSP